MSSFTPPPDGDQNRATELIVICWIEFIIALAFVAARFYSRIRITRNVWWDDWWILITLALTLGFSIAWTILALNNGCRHSYYLNDKEKTLATKLAWVSQPWPIMALATSKASVAFLILRIMGTSTWRRYFLYFLVAANFLFCSLAIIFTFAQCRPSRALWDHSIDGKCWNPKSQSSFSLMAGSFLAFTDICLAIIPISIVQKLQLSSKKKVGLSILLGMGIFAFVCAVIKTTKLGQLNARSDFTWETVDLWIWNANEVFVLIVAACIPTLRPLFLVILKRPISQAIQAHKPSYNSRSGSSHRARNAKLFTPPNQWKIIDSGPTQETWLDSASESRVVPEDDTRIRQTIELDVTSHPRPPTGTPVLRTTG